jgi:hypothetical protein
MSFLPAACQQSMASESLGAYRLGSARFVALGIEATGARMTSGTIRAFISAEHVFRAPRSGRRLLEHSAKVASLGCFVAVSPDSGGSPRALMHMDHMDHIHFGGLSS